MKKLILIFAALFLVGCAGQDNVEQTKSQKYEDTTFEEMLSDYEYAEGSTEWHQDDSKVIAESDIAVSDDVEMTQELVFDDEGFLEEIVWEREDNKESFDTRSEQEEILGLIYNQKPVLGSDMDELKDKAEDVLEDKAKEVFSNIKDKIKDEYF